MIYLYDPEITRKDISNVNKALNKKWLSGNTPVVKEFEKKLAGYLGVKYVSSCSSGTSALHLALLANSVGEGDEVIMPTLSYIATANAVKYVGANPVFVDVDINTWQINTSEIEKNITKKTKAIMPVHLYGGVPDLESISKIANSYKLKVIHDTAEALGSKYKNKFSTNFKDISILSFFPNKIMTTGEGGAVITNNKKEFQLIEKLKSQGLRGDVDYIHSQIGYNYRLNSLSAALGLSQIDRIEKNIKSKKILFEKYRSALEPLGFIFQNFEKNTNSSYWLVSTLVPKNISRDKLKTFLYKNNIETRNIFFPLHKQIPYKINNSNQKYEISESISNKGLCLPSSPNLTDKEFNKIIKSIKNYVL